MNLNLGSLAYFPPDQFAKFTLKFGMLKTSHELFGDIYSLLVQNTTNYLLENQFNNGDAEILAVFLIHTYGNHKDFKDFLFVHNDRYGLPAYLCNRLRDDIKEWRTEYLKLGKQKLNEIDQARINYNKVFTRALNETSIDDLEELALQLLAIESCHKSLQSDTEIYCDIKCLDNFNFKWSTLKLPYPDGFESLQGEIFRSS